jgi:predicted metal-dependent peptidase
VRWNIAADIVVNGIIAELQNIALPAGGLRDATLEKLPVEEVYEKLQGTTIKLALADLLEGDGASSDEAATTLGVEQRAAQWREALGQAETLSRMGVGKLPAGLVRAMGEVLAPTLDWRAMLWRFVTVTPSDFADYDRRFIYRGLYLDALVGESLHVAVAVDTSGSVSPRQLEGFLAELAGILSAYPHVSAWLYYIDTAIAGPYAVRDMAAVPAPRGGGGTSFEPFFAHVESTRGEVQRVLVYLTDGYGTFPKERPAEPVLWVVTAGGLASEQFPFGDVARLRES